MVRSRLESYNTVCPRLESCDMPRALMSVIPNLCCDETKTEKYKLAWQKHLRIQKHTFNQVCLIKLEDIYIFIYILFIYNIYIYIFTTCSCRSLEILLLIRNRKTLISECLKPKLNDIQCSYNIIFYFNLYYEISAQYSF